jgi:hypothetical protein
MHQDDAREEIFDVVNDHDQVIGSASREEVQTIAVILSFSYTGCETVTEKESYANG